MRLARTMWPLLALMLVACAATPTTDPAPGRAFDFQRDSFAFANELFWRYDAAGRRSDAPQSQDANTYGQRCFAFARTSRQFFEHARFAPDRPRLDDAAYRTLIDEVIARDSGAGGIDHDRVVIPGYADLRSFSRAEEGVVKQAFGSVLGSYFEIGNWRMIFPFSRAGQDETAGDLLAEVRANRPPIVHVVRFPHITINHVLLLFDARETAAGVSFSAYDPNDTQAPITLEYARANRTFFYSHTPYFEGGEVNVYEIYRGFWY